MSSYFSFKQNIICPSKGGNSNTLTGNEGNDIFMGMAGHDTFLGGTGIDKVLFNDVRNNFTLRKTEKGYSVSDQTGREGENTLIDIERILFDDIGIVLSIDGNASILAKLIGTIFGAAAIHNPEIIKIGLAYIDDGLTQEQLVEIVLDAAGAHTSEDITRLLWRNLFGSEADITQIQPYISQLDDDTLSQVDLTLFAADSYLNAENIDLIGLYDTGIAFAL